jgi:hypothetical protein
MGDIMSILAEIAMRHKVHFIEQFRSKLRSHHYFALQSIIECRTPACGEMEYRCEPCHQQQTLCHSCGHRSCPQCQHQANSVWLERQQKKLLPADYFMVTFTLPFELRAVAWQHQKVVYSALFEAAIQTLKAFAKRHKHLGDALGLTAVLHTHSRKLAYHPHIHVMLPAGSFHKKTLGWHTLKSKYLFNQAALAKVFRAKFLDALNKHQVRLPLSVPKKWIAQCQHVGKGLPALKYLARYLYRGVINENNIIHCDQHQVVFRYKESTTGQWKTQSQSPAQFLWLVIQHVLPKGFRRARDYGFLHGSAKRTLKKIQLMLKVCFKPIMTKMKTQKSCSCCGALMKVIMFSQLPKRQNGRLT